MTGILFVALSFVLAQPHPDACDPKNPKCALGSYCMLIIPPEDWRCLPKCKHKDGSDCPDSHPHCRPWPTFDSKTWRCFAPPLSTP